MEKYFLRIHGGPQYLTSTILEIKDISDVENDPQHPANIFSWMHGKSIYVTFPGEEFYLLWGHVIYSICVKEKGWIFDDYKDVSDLFICTNIELDKEIKRVLPQARRNYKLENELKKI